MNNADLNRAKEVIPDPQVLSVVAAKRARQLATGARPMINEYHIKDMEQEMDRIENEVGALGCFLIPGSTKGGAMLLLILSSVIR